MAGGTRALAALMTLLAGAAEAQPARWLVDAQRSVIAFDFALNGRPASGVFGLVSGAGDFDPARPQDTRLTLEIDVSSLDLGDPVESAFALSADWFDAERHPVARYRLSQLSARGGRDYEALGDLTIKGRTQVLRTPVTLELDAAGARAEGSLSFDRRDFGVGLGPSALFVAIGADVAVRFALVAAPAE